MDRRWFGTIFASAALGFACSSDGPAPEAALDHPVAPARVDLRATGNRVAREPTPLAAQPTTIELDGEPRWVLPAWEPSRSSLAWLVVLADQRTLHIELHDDGVTIDDVGSFDGRVPRLTSEGALVDATDEHGAFTDPLPDTRVVTDAVGSRYALSGPTDRYPHGVLGDEVEASSVERLDANGTLTSIVDVTGGDVIEAVSPMLADVDDDGETDLLVTVSNADVGARLVVVDRNGATIAESPPIGRGNRWRHLLGVAEVGPNGEVEVIEVRTPHIGGVLEFHRVDGDRLVAVATLEGFSTHRIGSRNLDQGVAVDVDGNGTLDVLLPTQDQRELVAIRRDATADDGVEEIGRVDLGARLGTNIGIADLAGDLSAIAVGTVDGRLLIYR